MSTTDVKAKTIASLPVLILVEVSDDSTLSRQILAPMDEFKAIGGMEAISDVNHWFSPIRKMMLSEEWKIYRSPIPTPLSDHPNITITIHQVSTSAVVRVTIPAVTLAHRRTQRPSDWPSGSGSESGSGESGSRRLYK